MTDRAYSYITTSCFIAGALATFSANRFPTSVWPTVLLIAAMVIGLVAYLFRMKPTDCEDQSTIEDQSHSQKETEKAIGTSFSVPQASIPQFQFATRDEAAALGVGVLSGRSTAHVLPRILAQQWYHYAKLEISEVVEMPTWQKAVEIRKMLTPDYQVKLMPGNVIEISGGLPSTSPALSKEEQNITPSVKLEEWKTEGRVQ